MSTIRPRHLAARIVSAALALALLASPTVGQLVAAETCRLRCEQPGAAAESACCRKPGSMNDAGDPGSVRHDRQDADDRAPATGSKYCPGCSARPLIATSQPVNLSLDVSPVSTPVTGRTAVHSAGVALSIFHPPRA